MKIRILMIFQQSQMFRYQFFSSKHGKLLALFCLSWVQIENLSRVDFTEHFHYFYFCQNMVIHKVFKHLLKVVTEYKMQKKEDMVLSRGWKFWFAFYQTFKEWSPLYLPTLKSGHLYEFILTKIDFLLIFRDKRLVSALWISRLSHFTIFWETIYIELCNNQGA